MSAAHWYVPKPNEIVFVEYILPFIGGNNRDRMIKYFLEIKESLPTQTVFNYRMRQFEWIAYESDTDQLEAAIKAGHMPPEITRMIFDPKEYSLEA